MDKLDTEYHRENWDKAVAGEALYLKRPALFSPAAAAQDAANRSRILWNWAPLWLPWEYTNWMDEGRSFHDSAYIGDWSALVKVRFKGPQAFDFLSYAGTNDLSKFAVGRVTHHVQVTEQGKIAGQGVLYRIAEDDFIFTGGSAFWSYHLLQKGNWDVEATIVSPDYFLFSVQGPQSLKILEAATEASLSHLRFNQWATFELAGAKVMVLRTGITGELGFELHGPSEFGNAVWSKVAEVGEAFGIKQLGVRAQLISHVEAGIATNDRDFISAAVSAGGGPQIKPSARSRMFGSYKPDSQDDLYRTPSEVNWFSQQSLDTHDFLGRDALLAERAAGEPAKKLVGLVWDNQGVIDVFATIFDEDPITPMDLPRQLTLSVDQILVGGACVGCSTSRVYSPYLRKMISLGFLDRSLAVVGDTVSILYGEAGGPQREIKARIVELPFKQDGRRS